MTTSLLSPTSSSRCQPPRKSWSLKETGFPRGGIARRRPGQHRRQQDREPAGSDHRRASRGGDSRGDHAPTDHHPSTKVGAAQGRKAPPLPRVVFGRLGVAIRPCRMTAVATHSGARATGPRGHEPGEPGGPGPQENGRERAPAQVDEAGKPPRTVAEDHPVGSRIEPEGPEDEVAAEHLRRRTVNGRLPAPCPAVGDQEVAGFRHHDPEGQDIRLVPAELDGDLPRRGATGRSAAPRARREGPARPPGWGGARKNGGGSPAAWRRSPASGGGTRRMSRRKGTHRARSTPGRTRSDPARSPPRRGRAVAEGEVVAIHVGGVGIEGRRLVDEPPVVEVRPAAGQLPAEPAAGQAEVLDVPGAERLPDVERPLLLGVDRESADLCGHHGIGRRERGQRDEGGRAGRAAGANGQRRGDQGDPAPADGEVDVGQPAFRPFRGGPPHDRSMIGGQRAGQDEQARQGEDESGPGLRRRGTPRSG